jgi:hypothetical protein
MLSPGPQPASGASPACLPNAYLVPAGLGCKFENLGKPDWTKQRILPGAAHASLLHTPLP